MHVIDLNARVEQMVGQVLGHALGERGHQHALLAGNALANLVLKIVNLAAYWTHVNLGVEQAGRTNNLLHVVLAHPQLVVARRGRNIDKLGYPCLKLVETKRAIIECRGQAKTVFHQRYLTRAVAFMHAADLRHRHMALVDDTEHVLRKVIDQGKRRLTRLATVQMTRVVLDAVAKAHRLEHLKIIIGALLQTLRLEQLVGRLELRHALLALFADRFQSRLDLRLLGHVVRCRPYGDGLVLTKHLTGDLIDLGNQLDLVAKELKPQRMLGIRRIHVDNIAAHAERAAR